MSYYNQYHPLVKTAGIKSLLNFIRNGWTNFKQNKWPTMWKEDVKPFMIGGGLGLPIGGYIGNKAFNNSIPPVRALPYYDQPMQIDVEGLKGLQGLQNGNFSNS